MTHSFKLSRRMARLRASVFAALVVGLVGCDTTDSLSPDDGTLPETGVTPASLEEPSLAAVRFAGGIPIGHHGQPLTAFGRYHNGAKMNIAPGALRSYLAAIKARGGKVVLMLAGNDKYYKDSRGFNLNKWKARVDRYKGINFSSYIKDGTVIGHFLVDEPNDPNNWNGRTISPSVVDEMARHSKQRWAGMPTLARVEPSYFRNYRARYLDGAWAQYVTRKGSASDYIRRNVADAQRADLSLVVGLNISKGGPNKRRLTPSQVKSFGSALLASSYPCAFISWTYGSYLTTGSMLDAMRFLRSKAQSRGTKTCRG